MYFLRKYILRNMLCMLTSQRENDKFKVDYKLGNNKLNKKTC